MSHNGISAPPPAAPPTMPGPIPAGAGRASSMAVASLACGLVGFIVPLVNVVAVVLGIAALRRIGRAEGPVLGRGYAVIGICAGIAGVLFNTMIGLTVWAGVLGYRNVSTMMSGPSPQMIHMQATASAQLKGVYPLHMAELALDNAGMGSWPIMMAIEGASITGPGQMTVGEYDMVNFDGSKAEQDALREALAGLDMTAQWYRFGDCRFVRLGKPRSNGRLIAAWSVNSVGEVNVVFDAGSERRSVSEELWSELWTKDADERERLGLPALEEPPFEGAVGLP